MAGRFFGIPFATTGDRVVVPDAVQPDGSVSFSTGFGFDYERPNADPTYKPVPRQGTNGLFHDVTEAIGIIQRQGYADFTTSAQPYSINSMVRHDGIVWRSLITNNSVTPIEGASWTAIDALATETSAGLTVVATQAETNAGVDDAKSVSPKKLRFGFSMSIGSGNGYITLPSWLGGVIFQYGAVLSNAAGFAPFSFPLAFPNLCGIVLASAGVGAGAQRFTATIIGTSILTTGVNSSVWNGDNQSSVAGQISVFYFAMGR